ncbi:MAG: hypothetical protein AB7Q29_04270 [Vicinamibacterales bacterium]
MKADTQQSPLARRSFLARMSAGAAAVGAVFTGRRVEAAAADSPGPGWVPARHGEDDWLDSTPAAKHRMFYDTVSPGAAAQAIFFARNFFSASTSGYKLSDAEVAQVICLRHQSTGFAFTDAMWAKYGFALSERAGHFLDPKTSKPPTINVLMSADYGSLLNNGGVTIDALAKRGVRFAVCGMATRAIANVVTQKTGADIDAVFKELTENLVPNGHMVPAGIVAVNRAQERGYTFSYVA